LSDVDSHTEIKIGSERSFGLTFAAVFAVITIWPVVFRGGSLRLVPLGIAILFLLVTFLFPAVLAPLNRLWFKFGLALAKITGPIVMAIVFVLAVVPTGFLKQRLGADPLRLKREPEAESYWIERTGDDGAGRSMKRQF
jgi:hypothetical protein